MSRLTTKVLLGLFFCFLPVVGIQAEELLTVWKKPTPVFEQKFDWLRLTSDEWLKGNIVSMFDDQLEFDSVEFDLHLFNWEDVAELRSRFDKQIRLSNGQIVEGFLIIKDGKLTIISNGIAHEYPLSDLLSITASSEKRLNLWGGKFGVGLNFLKGNVEQSDYTVTAKIERRSPLIRFRSDFIYNYSKQNNKELDSTIVSANSRRLTSYLDWFFSGDMFFRLLDFEHFSDELQNIKSRNILGSALGYHLLDNKRVLWDITAGPSYQQTTYQDSDITEESAVLALGTLLEYEFSSQIDFIFDYQVQFVDEKSGKIIHVLKTGISFDLTNDIDLDVNYYIDRISNPLPSISSVTPEQNDYRMAVVFGYRF